MKGVYHFRFSIHGAAPHPITVALHKNNDHMTGTYAHQSQNSVSSTNAISMLLEVGDVVFLRLIAKTWVYDNFFHHTTFSGHLLFSIWAIHHRMETVVKLFSYKWHLCFILPDFFVCVCVFFLINLKHQTRKCSDSSMSSFLPKFRNTRSLSGIKKKLQCCYFCF